MKKLTIRSTDEVKNVIEQAKVRQKLWYWKLYKNVQVKILWPFKFWWERVTDIPNKIKYFFQRGIRGYADEDTWSIDWYISSWLPQAIKELRDRKIGYPGIKGMTSKKWSTILTEIADGFEADRKYNNLEFDFMNKKQCEKLIQKKDRGMKLFVKWYNSLWD